MRRLRLTVPVRGPRLRRTFAAGFVGVLALGMLGVATGAAAVTPADLLLSEYIEGTSNNKAIEIFNGTGAAIDLAAGGYRLEVYFNGNPTSTLGVALTGTVAHDDVYVFASSLAAPAILAQADQTSGAGLFNGDDAVVLRRGGVSGPVVDSLGQVGFDPGTEWGTGLASTADNTLRRLSNVTAGDTDPTDVFDPVSSWIGFATDTFDGLGAHALDDGGPVDQPAVLICGPALVTTAGTAATRLVTATDPDDAVTNLDVTSVVPAPAAGSIARTAFIPAGEVGGTATAEVTVSAGVPAGAYAVTMTSTDADGTSASCTVSVQVAMVLAVGEVQGQTTDEEEGKTDRSPLAPASGNGSSSLQHFVRGVITQKTLARSSSGAEQNGFFLQSRAGFADGDPLTSDGIFVFMGTFTSLIGGYVPVVGDEVILRARVAEFFNLTQLTSASLVTLLESGVSDQVQVTDATPPADLADADRFWERHEGSRMRVRAGSVTTSGRDVFGSTADSEIWLVDVDSPLLDREDPFAARVFRDAHPLDDVPATLFDNGNGHRIMMASLGVKAQTQDSTTLLPPARTFERLTGDAVGGLYFSFEKYGVQVESAAFTPGADPSANAAPSPANRSEEYAVATFNVENLYDFRDDPFDGCDFAGNPGCPGVSPPFDYVPASAEDYTARLTELAGVVAGPMHSPDILLVQEAEDQDVCSVSGSSLLCGTSNDADGKPDTLQELALTIAATGGPAYDAAYDRDGADDRGIVAAFLYRTDRVSLAAAGTGVLSATPGVTYRGEALAYNADVQNPKSLNADLPSDVDTSTGVDGPNVYTRAPQVARFVVAAAPGSPDTFGLWAVSNHFSSTPDARVGQRREQAAYGAAIVAAIQTSEPDARVVYGGDLNVFPRPDDPVARSDSDPPSDQLAPLYDSGLFNMWDDLAAEVPAAAYSYVFQGQAQTLDHLFVSPSLHADLVTMRAAHVNAGWPADFDGDGARGVSDHDPQIARFRSRALLSVADVSVTEGTSGSTPALFTATVSRPLSVPVLICAVTLSITAADPQDYTGLGQCKTLAAGATSVQFTVSVRGDRRPEADETFALLAAGAPHLRLADPLAIGTIINDD